MGRRGDSANPGRNPRPSAARSGSAGVQSFRAASGAERQTPTGRSPGPTLRSARSPRARLRPPLASCPPLPTLPSGRGSGPRGGGSRPREAAVRRFPPAALPSPLGRGRHCTPGLPVSSPRLPPAPGERAGPLLPATQRRVCVNPRPLPAGRSCRPHAESVPPPPRHPRAAALHSTPGSTTAGSPVSPVQRSALRAEGRKGPPGSPSPGGAAPPPAQPPPPGARHGTAPRCHPARHRPRGAEENGAELCRAGPCRGQPSAAVCFVIKSIKLPLSSETGAGGGGGGTAAKARPLLWHRLSKAKSSSCWRKAFVADGNPPAREQFRFIIAFRAALLRFALHCAVLL